MVMVVVMIQRKRVMVAMMVWVHGWRAFAYHKTTSSVTRWVCGGVCVLCVYVFGVGLGIERGEAQTHTHAQTHTDTQTHLP